MEPTQAYDSVSRTWHAYSKLNGCSLELVGTRHQVLLAAADLLATPVNDLQLTEQTDW